MQMLSEDADPPYTHGVFAGIAKGGSVRVATAGPPPSIAETLLVPEALKKTDPPSDF